MADPQPPLFPEGEQSQGGLAKPSGAPGSDNDRVLLSILALSSLRGLGKGSILGLHRALGGVDKVWEADKSSLESALRRARAPRYKVLAEEIFEKRDSLLEKGERLKERLSSRNIRFVWGDELPESLRNIKDSPPWLFVQGDFGALYLRPAVAVVGTRRPSDKGREAARKVVRMLAAYPVAVVSGLAEGIDEEVHAEALGEGLRNVAFLGHGINVVFPKQTQRLRERIVESGGAIASEYLPDEKYNKAYFVQRNRLQAALSDLVIPIEAGEQSGTAHTVRFALEYQKGLVGVAWVGASGVQKLVREAGFPVVPVFSRQGLRQLDLTLQSLVRRAGRRPDPTSRAKKRFLSEISSRCLTREDRASLLGALKEFLEEMEEDECTQNP